MLKLDIEEFLFEIKDEIASYEELGIQHADKWEERFKKWLENEKIKKKNIKVQKGIKYYVIEDESEIFDMADKYYEAYEENKIEEYWSKFQ